MTETATEEPVGAPLAFEADLAGPGAKRLTPAGLQPTRTLTRRRLIVLALNLATLAAIGAGLARFFGAGGWTVADVTIFVCFLIGAPWTIMGFWNAVLGLWLLHGPRGGLHRAAPHLKAGEAARPVTSRTALLMFLRNEPPDRALARLAATRESLEREGAGALFDVYVLSDTDDPDIAAEEERAFAVWRDRLGPDPVYRRREKNTGWKAGNIRDWLERWGAPYDFFLPLDSDSLMSGADVLRLVRIAEAHPKIGILQSLVVGAPAESLFARVFQFGMRHGMRSFTMGAAWWHGDCGPYWGHNALVRVRPFRDRCDLPDLPGRGPLSGPVLSHDQLEAAFMRRAGYEVRVVPTEGESWEDNPPTLFEFTRRDLRWCQGNMQYLSRRILGAKGLKPMSRFQVFAAIMMYFGAPAWMLMTIAAAGKLFEHDLMDVDFAFAVSMFFIMFAVSLFPKIAGWIDIALTTGGAARYGGRLRFAAGALVETVFSILIAPIVAFRVSLFLLGLLFGRKVGWSGQARDAHRLGWRTAIRGLWPQTAFGFGLLAVIAANQPGVLPWAAPVLAGLCLAIPFAVLTSHPAGGRWAARIGLCATPDEFAEARTLTRLSELSQAR